MTYIILDTETANDIECPFVYDFGFAVIDETGKVFASYSFVNRDIFCDDEMMKSAYFAEKIPSYWNDIKNGNRILKSFYEIEKIFRRVCNEWNVNTFVAHNARFDYNALNNTKRYLTKSKYRFFFPFASRFIDTLKFSKSVLSKDEEYTAYCKEHEYRTANHQNRYTAEILFRYLTGDESFNEEHTGLADCMIEKEIFKFCMDNLTAENGYLW